MKAIAFLAALVAVNVNAEPAPDEIAGKIRASHNLAQRCDWDLKVHNKWSEACDAHLKLHNEIASWGVVEMTTYDYKLAGEIDVYHHTWNALGYLK